MSNGYPTVATIANTLVDTSGFDTSVAGEFRKSGAPTPANCRAAYAASVGGAFPQITIASSGC
jgi:hypothetical protein